MSTTTHSLPAVTDATFATVVGPGSGLVAVEFGAEWCPPCRLMEPIIEEAARTFAPRLTVVQVDADANPTTVARFGVRGLPTLLVLRNGDLVDRIVGATAKAPLFDRLRRLIEA